MTGGDGSQRTAEQVEPVVSTVIGGGSTWPIVDNVTPAVAVALIEPSGVAIAPDGTVYVADANATRNQILRINPDGTVWRAAGGGASTGDGVSPRATSLSGPYALAFGPDGTLYVTERGRFRVRRIDFTADTITTVAGDGTKCTSASAVCGDGGPALQAQFDNPSAVAVAPDGTLYIAKRGDRVRKVSTDGVIERFAGRGPNCCGNSTNTGIPATQALLFNSLMDLALGNDGSLYVSGGFQLVRRIAPDGRIYTVAGSPGLSGDAGDGGEGTQASMFQPTGLTLASDGTLFLADSAFDRIRRVRARGLITAAAGRQVGLNTTGFAGDEGPALAARFDFPVRLAVAGDDTLYIADLGNQRVRRVRSPLPGFAALGDIVIAARDGRELYVFDSRGKHRDTLDALTRDDQGNPVVLAHFGYDANDEHVVSVTDSNGRTTAIGRNAAGVTLTAPDGQVTTLALDGNGYVQSVSSPAGTHAVVAGHDGLITGLTDPNNHSRTFAYDAEGRLEHAADPPGADGSDSLARTALPVPNGSGYQVTHTTADNVQTTYRVEFLPDGTEARTTLNADGTEAVTQIHVDGSRTITQADGTVQTSRIGPDPRFGLQAPVTTDTTATTPDNVTASLTASRRVSPPGALLPTSQTETVVINNRPPSTSTFVAATRVTTDTSPAGRQTQTTVDAKGRVTRVQAASLHPLRLMYDPVSGEPTTMKYGPDPDTSATRTTTVTYVDDFAIAFEGYPASARGQVRSTTDAAGRATTFEYDGAGRVAAQILSGNRRVEFAYDSAGNVTSITPPGRPAHAFAYTPMNLDDAYTPPQVVPPLASVETTYAYTADRQLDLVTRPDAATIDYQYDPAGRLDALVLSAGNEVHDYVYDDPGGPGDETGHLAQIVAPQATLVFAYDGSLPTGEAWSGAGLTPASITRSYDSSFRLASQQIAVGGAPQPAIAFQYDHDDLLTQAGALTLTPDPATGLLRGTSLTAGGGTVTDAIDYTPFGEVEHYEARHNGSELLDFAYERDGLGRITRITETLTLAPDPPVVTDTHYRYDPAGRLYRVCADAACASVHAEYHYDANGNRIAPSFDSRGALSATNDAQDRLLAMTVGATTTTYTYTANGELHTKTDPSGATTYAYDAFGNLRQVALPDGTVIDYVVDGRNRRIGKLVDGILVRQWLYKDQLEPVAEMDGTGNLIAEFAYGSRPHSPDWIRRGGQTYRVISDHLGSVRVVVDAASGGIAQRIDYDAFGIVLADTDAGWQPFGYAGGIYDSDDPTASSPGTGLVRFGARDYDAGAGRWTAKDPIGFGAAEANQYAYVSSNPVNVIDPEGQYGLTGVLGGIAFNASVQLIANVYLTNDFRRSLECINVTDVAVSGLLGGIGPTFIGNILLGKLGPFAVRYLDNVAIWVTLSLPTGFSVKQILPDAVFGDDCESSPLGRILSGLAQ